MWPAIIGAVGSLVGSGVNAAVSSNAASTSYERQKQLMALQNQYAVENWNRENNYNSPKEQMKRLKEAGLNPDLVYGNGASGLQSGPISSPSAPSAPMQVTAPGDFGSTVSDAVQAAVGIRQSEKTKSETMAQDIRNKYIEEECNKALRNMDDTHGLNEETKKQIVQSVQASQAEMDALRKRVDNESFDRILSFMQTAGQLDYWENQKQLNDEQKKWLGTHAMAALLGAQGSYAQSKAIAEAIMLFRDPQKLKELINKYKELIKDEIKNSGDNKTLKDFEEIAEDLGNGDYIEALFGRKAVGYFKKWLKGDHYDGVK